jgi:hypothetical protein
MFQTEQLRKVSVGSGDGSIFTSLVAAARAIYEQGAGSQLSAHGVAASTQDLKVLRGVVDAFDGVLRTRSRELQVPKPSPQTDSHPTPVPASHPINDKGLDLGEQATPDLSQTGMDRASGVSAAVGRRRERHARVLADFPQFAAALVAGEVTDGHIGILAEALYTSAEEVWRGLRAEECDLLIGAGRSGPTAFKRLVSQTLVRIAAGLGVGPDRDLSAELFASMWIDKTSGLGRLSATFDPSSFAQVSALLNKAVGKMRFADRKLTEKEALGQVVLNLLTGELTRSGGGVGGVGGAGVKPVVSILIDEKTLISGPHVDTICEYDNGSRVPVHLAQEIACTATLTPILRDKWGVVLDLGRDFRWAQPAQRRAMEAMYATCFHEACETSVTQCDYHHIKYWEHGGTTDMVNLLPICQHHHRWIHAHSPHIEVDEHRKVIVTMADGSQSVHLPDRQPHRRAQRMPDSSGSDGSESGSVRTYASAS